MKDKTALVVEGGGMRGIFAAGVLDVFMEKNYDPFHIYIGVSSGALNLNSLLSRQHKRNYNFIMRSARDPEFISWKKYIKGGHLFDLDWLMDVGFKRVPLDLDTLFSNNNGKKYWVATTSVETGNPVFIEPQVENFEDCMKATSAIPAIYRTPVNVNGCLLMDGAVAAPIPVQEACRQGANNIVVIRSRPSGMGKSASLSNRMVAFFARKNPMLSGALRNQHEYYAEAISWMENPPVGVNVSQIAPPGEMKTGRATTNVGALEEDYLNGRTQAEKYLASLEIK
jgi:predicted patatin/cPLA2 family phospholipase